MYPGAMNPPGTQPLDPRRHAGPAASHEDAARSSLYENGTLARATDSRGRRRSASRMPESRRPESRAPESRIPESRAPESRPPESRGGACAGGPSLALSVIMLLASSAFACESEDQARLEAASRQLAEKGAKLGAEASERIGDGLEKGAKRARVGVEQGVAAAQAGAEVAQEKVEDAVQRLAGATARARALLYDKAIDMRKELANAASVAESAGEAMREPPPSLPPLAGIDAVECSGTDAKRSCVLPRVLLADISERPENLAQHLQISTTTIDGVRGLFLDQIRVGSLPHALGLRSGDLLFRVNDTPLASLTDVAKLREEKPSTGLVLHIRRAGEVNQLELRAGAPVPQRP